MIAMENRIRINRTLLKKIFGRSSAKDLKRDRDRG
jgi:hypothetical protein